MYTITRKQHVNSHWKMFLIFFGVTAVLSSIWQRIVGAFDYRVLQQPFLPGIFGDSVMLIEAFSFAFIVIFFIVVLVISVFFGDKNKLSSIINEEKKKFKERFKTNLSFKTKKSNISNVFIAVSFLIGTPILIYFSRASNVNSIFTSDNIEYILGAAYMVGLGYLFKKLKKDSHPFTQIVLDYINTAEPNTKLVIPDSSNRNGLKSASMSNEFSGIYHQRAVQFSYTVKISIAGGRVGGNSKTTLQLSGDDSLTTTPITITERDSTWKTIEADTLDHCFEQRFTVDGVDVHQLSSDFKQLLVQRLHNIQLTIEGKTLQYSNTDIEHKAAVHSMESMILLIDWGDQVMTALEKSALQKA